MKPPVDMSAEAVTERLRRASALSDLSNPFRPRVDMSADAITERLREASRLSALARALAKAGEAARRG